MHKIKKGIKKKIKGKKGKKDDPNDLFDPDQLAKYKEELDAAAAAKAAEGGQDSQEEEESCSAAPGKSHEEDEEWKKFKALTSGVDNVLKKTTGDLDRIKSTSFFQRAPPNPAFILPTTSTKVKATPKRPDHLPETSKDAEQHHQQQQKQGKSWIGFEAGKEHGGSESETEEHHKGEGSGAGDSTVEVEEKQPESPDVEAIQIEDDIFDTSFVDRVDAGEIKLSYVPDSPVDDGPVEDDPFDTTCATEIVKKIEEEERKKKRQVNLGTAVNFLTGGDSNSSTAPAPVGVSLSANNASLKRKRRPRPHHVNLLGDDGSAPTKLEELLPDDREQQQKQQSGRSTSPANDLFDSILGSPPPEDIGELTVPLVKADSDSKNTNSKSTSDSHTPANEDSLNLKELLSEFDVISEVPVSTGPTKTNLGALLGEENEDDLEDEFAALAAESIHKTTTSGGQEEEEATTPLSPDPFDTTIVDSLLPGKTELKLIESELLAEDNNTNKNKNDDDDDDFDFDPRAGEEEHTVVVINNNSDQQKLSTGTLQKDLLGGSATDLSELATVDTLHPVSDGLIETEVDDPFDTSVVEKLLPGKAELKLLEAEFLQDSETGGVKPVVVVPSVPAPIVDDDDDFDFDPRKDEVKQNVTQQQQQVSTPQKQKPVRPPPPPKVPEIHPLDSCFESETAHSESVQTLVPQEAEEEEIDPFDTSAATAAILPGKLELKLLESELVPSSNTNNNNTSGDSINTNNNVNSVNSVSFDPLDIADSDFDPRASEERREYPQPISTANLISSSNNNNNNTNNPHDFLDHHSELIEAHTLTPINANTGGAEELELDDPFDTSHLVQSKILPGKAELNLLAKEFLDSTQDAPPPSLPVIPVLQPSTIEQSRPKVPEKVPEPHPLDEFNDEHHNSLGHVPTLQPLTPGQFEDSNTNFDDPFDTSIANTIVPGKAELKILEAELGFDPNNRRLSDPDFNPRGTIHPSCNLSSNTLIPQTVPLIPAQASQSNQQQVTEDIDPFDTSSVDTVLPEDKMATKGFNPFLSEADYAAPSAEIQSNPFLDFGAPPPPTSLPLDKPSGGNENPFSNPFGVPAPVPAPSNAAANAFMYGDTTEAPASGGGGGNPFAAFVDASSSSNNSNGPFSAINTSSSSTIVGESTTTTTSSSANMWDNLVTNQPVTATAAALVPEPIFMMDTGPDENISFFDAGQSGGVPAQQQQPPVSTVHPSTQELLNSVTGALEANSESLMDRLRLNQPSPVNLGVSPSPSPRSPSPDLLMTDEHTPPAPPSSANPLTNPSNTNIMDLFDSPVPQPSGPKSNIDILGLYNNNSMTQSQQPQQQQQPPVSIAAVPPSIEETTTTTTSLVDTDLPPPPMPRPPTIEDINFESTQVPKSVSITNDISDLPSPPPPPAPEPTITSPVIPEVSKPPPELPPAPAPIPQPIPTPQPVPEPPRSHPPPPKPPAPAVAPARSPVHETKPLPSRPPPPVPPSPRMAGPPHPPAPVIPPAPVSVSAPGHHHGQPPPIPQAPPVVAREHESHQPPPHPPAPHVAPPPPEPPVVKQQSPVVERQAPSIPSSSPFGDTFDQPSKPSAASIFGTSAFTATDVVVSPPTATPAPAFDIGNKVGTGATTTKSAAAFDDFDAKFNSINNEELSSGGGGGASGNSGGAFGDPFGGTVVVTDTGDSAWGSSSGGGGGGFGDDRSGGFGADTFDSFLQMNEPPPVPQSTPHKIKRPGEEDEERDDQDLAIFIKPRTDNELSFGLAPALAPPPKSPAISTNSGYSEDSNNAFVPFLSSARDTAYEPAAAQTQLNRTDSSETPQTPLFEEDTSQPLEDFPRTKYETDGWEMHMRHPNKKKITGQRFWKKVYVKIVVQNDIPIVHIYTNKGDKDPLQEIPLQPCYSVSDIGAQQFDQFGKIFTLKIQYVFYKERPGVRPGQISKAGRISDKLSQFAAFAIQGDYQGVKEFGSDLKKLGLPLEHAPQISQLVKLGIQDYEELKQFSACVEEALFKLNVHRDRAIQYKTEEVQVTLVDEYYVEQDIYGVVTRQIARVRLMFLSFLSGIAEVEMGMNDIHRQGKEIVGRHDIVPIATEEWIRTEAIEFSNCVQLDEYENTKTIKFKPPDACYLELLRFRVRPPRHRELPLQVKTVFTTTGNRIEIRSDILVPGFTSRKLGQIPCEDVSIRIPIPECWIYMFRVEKHFRYGSVKSSHRRSGKVKGIERFLGAVEAVEPSLMEVTSGQAKYEHHFKAIVWRIPRLPKEGQGAYTTHSFFCHIHLQAHEQVPDNLAKQCIVEFTMPHTTISHTVVRSIAVPGCEEPPEKCVRYLARCEFVVDIEHTQGIAPATYNLAAAVTKEEKKEPEAPVSSDRTADWFPTEKPKADDDSDFSD